MRLEPENGARYPVYQQSRDMAVRTGLSTTSEPPGSIRESEMDFALTPGPFSPTRDPRQNNFDLLRFLFASLVVFSHSYAIVVPRSDTATEPLAFLSGRQMSLGTLSVYGFFAISGFLIAQSWTRSRGFGDFLKKRALRLYPGFAVMTLFCALFVVPLAKQNFPTVSATLFGKIVSRVAIFDAWEDPAAFAGHVDPGIN